MKKLFFIPMSLSSFWRAVVGYLAKNGSKGVGWLKVATVFSFFIFHFNALFAQEIPGGWGKIELGMSISSAASELAKICNKHPLRVRRQGGDCGLFEGEKIKSISVGEDGLPFFKKVSYVSLVFDYRSGLFEKFLASLSHWGLREPPYCLVPNESSSIADAYSFDLYKKIPFTEQKSTTEVQCMAWFANGRVFLHNVNEEHYGGYVSIEYRDWGKSK